MNRKINLVVKSEKQYNKAVKKLTALGAVGFFLSGYTESKVGFNDYGIGCFIRHNEFKFTDGTSSVQDGWENFYTVKAFIAAVVNAQQEQSHED